MTMNLMQHSWELRLLGLAEEALNTNALEAEINVDSTLLTAAYAHCEAVTKHHSKTFFIASGLLPEDQRRAARALYAFCRVTDDIVDRAVDKSQRQVQLELWRHTINSETPPHDDLVALAWADTQQRFNIPHGYSQQLIRGVSRDLTRVSYENFDELAEYSYDVASTVGLMAMHIIGFRDERALPYAVKLGVALQITNILRDVAEDWRGGRLYLPREEMDTFGVTDEMIDKGLNTPEWKAFMRFQIERNYQLYDESMPGIAMLNKSGRFAIGAAAELYRAILNDIERHDYNVFTRRSHVKLSEKVYRLPGIWWRSRRYTV